MTDVAENKMLIRLPKIVQFCLGEGKGFVCFFRRETKMSQWNVINALLDDGPANRVASPGVERLRACINVE